MARHPCNGLGIKQLGGIHKPALQTSLSLRQTQKQIELNGLIIKGKGADGERACLRNWQWLFHESKDHLNERGVAQIPARVQLFNQTFKLNLLMGLSLGEHALEAFHELGKSRVAA